MKRPEYFTAAVSVSYNYEMHIAEGQFIVFHLLLHNWILFKSTLLFRLFTCTSGAAVSSCSAGHRTTSGCEGVLSWQ